MRSNLHKNILATILIATTLTMQFLPGFAAKLHAEEGDVAPQENSQSPSESNNESASNESAVSESGTDADSGNTEDAPETTIEETVADESTDSTSSESTGESTHEESTDPETTTTDVPINEGDDSTPPGTSSQESSSGNSSGTTTNVVIDEIEETATTTNGTVATSTPNPTNSPEVIISHSTTTPGQTISTLATSTATSTPNATSTVMDIDTTTATSTATSTTATTTEETVPMTSTSTPVIQSGHAVAMANILNILNANMVNSEGAILLSNFFDDQFGTLDLRGTGGGNCGLITCNSNGIQINLLNTAEIANTIAVTATSGENVIDGAGDGTINTGDAYAGLNLVNVANTNFVDSRYLLVSMNAFRSINGDIVFPSLSSFFTSLNPNSATQNISNNAEIQNNVSVTANTGNNTASTASSTISTGNAISTNNVFNSINTNLSGGNTMHILLRVHGSWVGEIFGGSDEFQALRSNSSVYLTNGVSGPGSNSSVNSTNTATISNNVTVSADTGNNEVRNASSSIIETGDAYAAANILNVANANVIGKNWMLAIINIFGDFNGNVSFGRPDLWVGEQITAPAKVKNGTTLEYKFTVINNGDLQATQVKLRDTYHKNIDVLSSSHTYTEENGTMTWNIGTIPPGGATEISYTAQVSGAKPGTKIENTVTVTGHEPDNNTGDNTDTAHVWTAEKVIRVKREKEIPDDTAALATTTKTTPLSAVIVTRSTQSSVANNVSTKVPQELIIKNPTAYPVRSLMLRDTMRDPEGKVVQTEDWNIGDLLPHEEVILTYDIQFGLLAKPGEYILSTALRGPASTTRTISSNGIVSLLAPEPVAIFSPKKSEASQTATTTSSTPATIEPLPKYTVENANLVASPAETGFDFDLWWLVLLATGSGLIWSGLKVKRSGV
jgi:hypothetical protein